MDRLNIYSAIGVKEIWRFDGSNLWIYILENGIYQVKEQSQVLSFFKKQGQVGENALIKEFREWLQHQI